MSRSCDPLRALLAFEKYKTTNYEIIEIRRYSRNTLQWNKNDMKTTTGDCWFYAKQNLLQFQCPMMYINVLSLHVYVKQHLGVQALSSSSWMLVDTI